MKDKWHRPAPVHAYRLLWSCNARMVRLMERRLREYGASEAQYGVLRCVPQNGGITASELAHAILRGKSNLTTLIVRMERAGLIRTEADPEDGRRRKITLTARGREAQEQLVPPVYEFIGNLFSCFSEEETEQLLSFLRRLNMHLENQGGREGAASGLRTTPTTGNGKQGGLQGRGVIRQITEDEAGGVAGAELEGGIG